MESSPTKNPVFEAKMGVNAKKKTHKLVRKSVRNKDISQMNSEVLQNPQIQQPKSIDRVSGLQKIPQNKIQINVDHGLNQNQI